MRQENPELANRIVNELQAERDAVNWEKLLYSADEG
jgi:hypothetical protein